MAAGVQLNYGSQSDRGLLPGQWADSGPHDVISLTNKDPMAKQVDDATVGGAWAAGNVYTWSIDGIAYSYTTVAADANNDGVATAIAAQMLAEPLFGGRIYPTAAASVVTLTARISGLGWTYVAGTNLTVVNTTANDEADAVPFGVGVLDGGQSSDGLERYGKLAQATSLTARAVVLTPTAAPNTRYYADVTVDDRTYHADHISEVAALLLTGAVVGGTDVTWTARHAGIEGEDIQIELVDPAANDAPLWISVADDVITVHLATDGGGAITSTAAEVVAVLVAGSGSELQATLNVGAADAQIAFTARIPGLDGNDITIGIVAGGAASDPLTVVVDGNAITIQPSVNDINAISCTANEVIEAIEAGTPRIVTGGNLADDEVQWENISGMPLSIVITTAAAAGVAVVDGADGIIVITFDGAAGGSTADAMITAVNADPAAAVLVHLQYAAGGAGTGNITALAATPLDPVPSMDEANGLLTAAATGTGIDNVAAAVMDNLAGGRPGHSADLIVDAATVAGGGVQVAAVAANLVSPAEAAADINTALAATLNDLLPLLTVIVTAAGTLTLTSELAGKDFSYSVGYDGVAAEWTVTSDNEAMATDLMDLLAGISVHTYDVEMNSDGEAEYAGESCMSIGQDGRIVVNTEDEVTMGTSVPYMRLADSLATGNQVGGIRASAATDCVQLVGYRFARKINSTQAVLEHI